MTVKESLFWATEEISVTDTAYHSAKGEKNSKQWLRDSGATSHMCTSNDFLKDLDPKVNGYVQIDDGTKKKVHGRGSAIINCSVDGKVNEITRRDTLYVPSFSTILLSVKKLAKDGYGVVFKDGGCKVIKDEATIAVRRIYAAERACTAIRAGAHGKDCQHVSHRRFGHRDPSAIQSIFEKDLVTSMTIKYCERREVCECCIKGKMARQPFPKEAEHSTRLDSHSTHGCLRAYADGHSREEEVRDDAH